MRASACDRKMVATGAFCMPETIRDLEGAKGREHMKFTRYKHFDWGGKYEITQMHAGLFCDIIKKW